MRTKSLTAIVMALILVFSVSALAAPQLIDYQGYIESSIGNPITDTLSITFTIYTASSGGTSKWSETQSNVAILGGLFNVTLGSSTALPDTVFNDNTRYLAITIASVELTPRTRIVSTAYAHRVNSIDGASGGNIGGDISMSLMSSTAAKIGFLNSLPGTYSLVVGSNNDCFATKSAICSGESNTVDSFLFYSAILSGWHNRAMQDYIVIGGGLYDTATADFNVIGGGSFNKTSADYAVIPGGLSNAASGRYSYAAGRRAKSNHTGAFVWADSTNSDFASSAVNQFNVRASGGTRIYSNSGATTGVLLAAGGGSWSSASDSTLKRNARVVDGQEILSNLMRLPVKQ